jgi:hypothetical protein
LPVAELPDEELPELMLMLAPFDAGLASSWSAFLAEELDDFDDDDLLPARAAMLALAKASRLTAIRA